MMPWIPPITEGPGSPMPGHYVVGHTILGYYPFSIEEINFAKQKRKELNQLREQFLKFQKECGVRKDIEGARYFREEASELMKQYRGMDFAIKLVEGDVENGWGGVIDEVISRYADRAFNQIVYSVAKVLEI